MATIRPGKADNWQAIIRRKGHPTKSKTFPTKRQAERWAAVQEVELAERAHLTPISQTTTVAALLKKYKADITPRKRSSVKEDSRITILSDHLGRYTLSELTPEVIIDFVDDRLDDVVADTLRKELSTLKVAVDAGMALWGYHLPANPVTTAKGILRVTKTLQPGVRRARRPTAEELEKLRAAAPGLMPRLIDFAVETAMRRGEISNQRAEHRHGSILNIPETKTDRPRRIPLSALAVEILKSLPAREDGRVWGMEAGSISQSFRRACAEIEVRDLRFHDLRHEATSRFFERGLNIAEVALITGQSLQTMQRYTHIKAETVVDKLG